MKNLFVSTALLILFGCASSSYFLTGGNRAAGSVTLTCNYDITTRCEPNYSEMQSSASEACKKWGYHYAEAFGAVKTVRTDDYAGYHEMQYQCVGHLEK